MWSVNHYFINVTLVTGGDCGCENRAEHLSNGYLEKCLKCDTTYSLRLKVVI